MNPRAIRLGISPCPNDTFTFHGLLSGAIRPAGFELEIELADVEELNRAFEARRLDASKASFFAALRLAHECVVLRAGSALGFGVGPLLLSRPGAPPLAHARVLCPGERTTAHGLFRSFHPEAVRVEQVVFSEVLPRLERGAADYGVCIHEGRFTFARYGLELVEDLGASWERVTGAPLPLGGIVAQRALAPEIVRELDLAIGRSLDHARAHPDEARATMRAHAQELDDAVIAQHVELYVNAWTRDLGTVGERALGLLHARALECGLLPRGTPPLSIRQ